MGHQRTVSNIIEHFRSGIAKPVQDAEARLAAWYPQGTPGVFIEYPEEQIEAPAGPEEDPRAEWLTLVIEPGTESRRLKGDYKDRGVRLQGAVYVVVRVEKNRGMNAAMFWTDAVCGVLGNTATPEPDGVRLQEAQILPIDDENRLVYQVSVVFKSDYERFSRG